MKRVVAAAVVLCVAGCNMEAPEAPPCDDVLPRAAELLADPAFASLRYHKRIDFDVARGLGYDMWGDARFEYRVALQFSLVPQPNARNNSQLCAQAVALRFAMPPDEDKQRKLRAFVAAVARRSSFGAEQLQARVAERLQKGERFAAVAIAGPVSTQAGMVSHPSRGDFFVVSFGRRVP